MVGVRDIPMELYPQSIAFSSSFSIAVDVEILFDAVVTNDWIGV